MFKNPISKSIKVAAMAASLAVITACTPPSANGGVYSSSNVMRAADVQYGTVVSGRYVAIQNMPGDQDQIAGAAIGGIAGALVGNKFGKGNGNTLMTGAGAIAGAALGANISKNANRATAQEWIVRLDNGRSIAIVQNDTNLAPGARVTVVTQGQKTTLSRIM
jgi:outer membrane lipoprotein SlyB